MILRSLVLFVAAAGALQAEINAYTADSAGVADAIDVATDAWLTSIPVGSNPLNLAVSPDGSLVYVANGADHTVTVIETETNTPISTIDVGVGSTLFVAFSPNGTRAYAVNYRGAPLLSSVAVIDTTAMGGMGMVVPGTPVTVGIESQMVALTPDGSQAWVPNYNNPALSSDVSVIRTSDNTVIATIPVQRRPIWLAIRPQGDEVYVANYFTGSISVLSTATFADVVPPITVGIGISPQHIAITPDGLEAYVANLDSDSVSVINTATHMVSHVIMVGSAPYFIAITPDGKRAYVANNGSDDVTVIDIATHSVLVPSIPVGNAPVQLAVSPDNKKVYVANQSSSFVSSILNADVPSFLTNIPTDGHLNWVAFTPLFAQEISVSGFQATNRFLTQTDRVNFLSWTALNDPNVVAYEVYRDADLTDLAGVVSVSGPLQLADHRVPRGVAITYYIVTVDPDGDRAVQAVFTLNPQCN